MDFQVGCTTEILVIVELSKYWPQLENINVGYSLLVDNNCVVYLLKVGHLQNLNVAGTSVSNSYRRLLSGLPKFQKIVCFNPIEPVLRDLTGYFHSVTRLNGNISIAGLQVQKHSNINELISLCNTEDTWGLGELRSVSTLTIIRGICIVMRFSASRRFCTKYTSLEVY
jgi:hypothetical protein